MLLCVYPWGDQGLGSLWILMMIWGVSVDKTWLDSITAIIFKSTSLHVLKIFF